MSTPNSESIKAQIFGKTSRNLVLIVKLTGETFNEYF